MSKMMLICNKVIACMAVFTVFVYSWKVLRYFLVDDTLSYTRITMHEFYEQDAIDTVFVGASHCYRSFVPSIINEKAGVCSFNLGSSNQQIDLSFLLMQEAVEKYDIKNIIVEVSFNMATYGVVREDKLGIKNAWIITDYMKPSIRKYIYLLRASNSDHYANSFFVARRNWKNLFEPQILDAMFTKKSSASYKEYGYEFVTYDNEYYAEKGYVANDIIIADNSYFLPNGYLPIHCEDLGENWRGIVEQMISYCHEKNIRLTFVSTPVSSFLNAGRTNYDEYIDYMNCLLEGSDAEYIDFNLMKEKYWPDTSEYFMDDNHLNKYGAELLSEIYSNLLSGNITKEELLYDSMDEKFMNLEPTIYGISYLDDMEGDNRIRKCKVVSNYSKNLLYKIMLQPVEGGEIEVQDYSDNIYFEISPNDHGVCVISYKNTLSADDDTFTAEVKY